MSFKFGNFIKDEIAYESLQQFLKKFKLPYSFKKEVLFDNIEKELTKESPKLSEEDIYELINHEIKYGRRRYLFTSIMNNSDSRKLESDRNIGNAIRELTGSSTNTYINNLNTYESNTFSKDLINELIIEYLNIKKDGTVIKKIDICFAYFNEVTIKNKDESESKVQTKEYVWVEINTNKRYVCVRLHPPKQDIFGTNRSAIILYNTIIKIINKSFGISEIDVTNFNETLYHIFKDITDVSEKPFRDKIKPHLDLIEPFIKGVEGSGVFEKASSHHLFKERVVDLLERVVIQENFSQYLGYAEDKDGVLNKMQFTDETGASVNASSGTKEGDTLELSDVFFDTRKTIEKKKCLDTLWIDWFKIIQHNEEQLPIRISTKFDSSTYYYLIHFRRIHLSEEVEKFVFSKLTNYEGIRWG